MAASLQWFEVRRVGVIRFGASHIDWRAQDPYDGVAVILDLGGSRCSIGPLAGVMPPGTHDLILDLLAADGFRVADVCRRKVWFRYALTSKPYSRRRVTP